MKDDKTPARDAPPDMPPKMLEYETSTTLPTGMVWEAIKADPSWLVWKAEWNAAKGKWDKPPQRPTGGTADRAKAATLTYDEAVKAARRLRDRTGEPHAIGYFCRPDSPVRALDLDDLDDPNQPEKAETRDAILDLGETYIELSPSGAGLRVWFARDNGIGDRGWSREGYEYSGADGKFMTFTGAGIGTTREIGPAPQTYALMRSRYEAAGAGSGSANTLPEEDWDRLGFSAHPSRSLEEMLIAHEAAIETDGAYRRAVLGNDDERVWLNMPGERRRIDRSHKLAQHAVAAKRLGWTIDEWADVVQNVETLGGGHVADLSTGDGLYYRDMQERALERAWNRTPVNSRAQSERLSAALAEVMKTPLDAETRFALASLTPGSAPTGQTTCNGEDDGEVIEDPNTIDLLRPPGLAGELVDWALKSSHRNNPTMVLAGVLVAGSALAGSRYFVKMDNRHTCLMLHAMVLGGSGSGKESARRTVAKLLETTSMRNLMYERPASEAGMMRAMADNQGVALFFFDEYGRMLLSTLSKGGTSGHTAEIVEKLKEVWGRGDGVTYARAYKRTKDDIKEVVLPSAPTLMMSTPDIFYEALQTDRVEDGFLPRLLVLKGPDFAPKHPRGHQYPDLPGHLATCLRRIPAAASRSMAAAMAAVGQAVETETPAPTEDRETLYGREITAIVPSADAVEVFHDFDDEAEARIAEGGVGGTIWNRAVEQAIRVAGVIALLNAAGTNAVQTPEIDADAARWAVDRVRASVETLRADVGLKMSTGSVSGDVQRKIMELILEETRANTANPHRAGSGVDPDYTQAGWVRLSHVTRRAGKSRKWNRQAVQPELDQMHESGWFEIVEVELNGDGKVVKAQPAPSDQRQRQGATMPRYVRFTPQGVRAMKDEWGWA